MSVPVADYSSNVFINCPFDQIYKPFFEATIFCIYDCGFIARCAREDDDAGNVRILKIMNIIDECKYGIHDISKADLDITTNLARFNMPLELGLFLGARHFAQKASHNKDKRTLIMDIEQFRYQQFISDLSGQDIVAHHQSLLELITHTRNFLSTNSRRTTIPGGQYIFDRFNTFITDLPASCINRHWDRNNLTFIDFSTSVIAWINDNKVS